MALTRIRLTPKERNDEVWLARYIPLEDNVANYPPLADTRKEDGSSAANKIITLLLFLHLPFLQMLR
jgi:hypothetical protein